jgi:hypothetical protein
MKYLACCATLATLAASSDALAVGSIASVTLIDRDSGAVLSTHYFRGEYWVTGKPGDRYAIEIRNRIGTRVLAVTSVDGVNVLSGATAGWEQAGYVFEPGQRYQITGWRKTHTQVASFTFTDSPNSYAERTGRPDNVGIIGIALFRERPPERADLPPTIAPAPREQSLGADANERRFTPPTQGAAASPVPAPKLGTGHGEREFSYVADTEFHRMRSQPDEVIRIRYDSLENLVAMGIIRQPRARVPVINPFPASPEQAFVPDPPGGQGMPAAIMD